MTGAIIHVPGSYLKFNANVYQWSRLDLHFKKEQLPPEIMYIKYPQLLQFIYCIDGRMVFKTFLKSAPSDGRRTPGTDVLWKRLGGRTEDKKELMS